VTMPQVLLCGPPSQRLKSLYLVRCQCVFISDLAELKPGGATVVVVDTPDTPLLASICQQIGSESAMVVLVIGETFVPDLACSESAVTWDFLPAAAPIGWLSRMVQRWVDRCANQMPLDTRDAKLDAENIASGFQALFHLLPTPALMVEKNHQIYAVNQAFLTQFGYQREQLQGQNIQTLIAEDHQAVLFACLSRCGVLNDAEVALPLLDHVGQQDVFLIKSIRLIAHAAHWILYVPSLESEYQLQQELSTLRGSLNSMVEAQVADRVRVKQEIDSSARLMDEFLGNMSYGFRTPLTDILGYACMGQDEADVADNDTLKTYFDCIQCSGTTMLSLINDLLDLWKFEADQMGLVLTPGNVRQLIQQILLELEAPITQAGLLCSVENHGQPVSLAFDHNRFHRAILAVVLYIVQHSEAGSKLKIQIEAVEEAGQTCVLIHFWSQAMALPIDAKKLFDKFEQSRQESFVSSLALPLAKEILEAHGGRVYAQMRAPGAEIVMKIWAREG